MAGVLGDMRRHIHRAQFVDEVGASKRLSPPSVIGSPPRMSAISASPTLRSRRLVPIAPIAFATPRSAGKNAGQSRATFTLTSGHTMRNAFLILEHRSRLLSTRRF
jgi:hypothetical protein